ncbi:MAG TPA: TetR/AcrR family transcriptional regulator [Rugosimonospora sp.]|nr:TetR/AcrR family transcriptional regulator [Rugosimonospora sp.]
MSPRAGARTAAPAREKRERKPLTTRWSRDDWTAEALELLMAEGVGAVKITRLCAALGVTKGSFYWHFADLDELLEAMAAQWSATTRQALQSLATLDQLPPVTRLQRMTERLLDDGTRAVERAMRDWARTDEQVAEVVAESDLFVFDIVQQALLDLGFDATQARLRAGTLVYAGIGFAHGHRSLPTPTKSEVSKILTMITDTGAPARGPRRAR